METMGCFLVLRKLLFVSFCVVVWVLFSVFSIFCITSLVSATPRNHKTMVMKNWGGGVGGQTRCIIMVSVKMANKISRSLRTIRYKLYPNRLNRLKRVQKLLRLKSSLKVGMTQTSGMSSPSSFPK